MGYERNIRMALRLLMQGMWLVFIGFAMFFSTCVSTIAGELPAVQPGEVGLSKERLERLDMMLQKAVNKKRVAGIVAVVARHGHVVYHKAYGWADIQSNRGMRKDDMFRLYSMTKPIVSTALLMLYEEGRFQLTDPLEKHIPGFKDVKVFAGLDDKGRMILEDPGRKPTIQDVFRHTTGLVSGLGPGPVNDLYREHGLTIDRLESLRQEVKTLATMPLRFNPGERWEYGLNHDVQAYLVEYFSGMPLDQFLRQRLFEPLGMKDSVFGIPPDHAARFATSYRRGNGKLEAAETATTGPYTRFTTRPFGTFGLSSTARDYTRFALMLLNGGELDGERVLGRKTVEFMTQNQLPPGVFASAIQGAPMSSGYGLGVSVTLSPAANGILGSPGSFGWWGAATTKFHIDPAEDLVAVIMAQHMPVDSSLLNRFQTLVYQAIVK